MRKILLIIVLCSMSIFTMQAQKAGIVFSSDKVAERNCVSKLKILKNGNVANIDMIGNVGIVCKLFDTNKKKVSEVTVPLKEDIRKCRLRSVLDINNDLMVMVVTYKDDVPNLYRYLFDGSTGKLKSEVVLHTMPEITGTPKYRINLGTYTLPDFWIEKDPISDCYAVLLCDIYSNDPNKQIEVVHYSSSHEKINRAFFISPENTFKYNMACDMYVNGAESVLLSIYVCNSTKQKSSEVAYYYLSQLNKGTTVFKNKILTQTIPFSSLIDRDCKLVYDKTTRNVKALIRIPNTSSGNEFDSFINQTINPTTLEFLKKVEVKMTKACMYFKTNITDKEEYKGSVHNYIIDQKGNDIYLAQPTDVFQITTQITKPDGEAYSKSDVKEIAITCMSSDGIEKYGSIIPYGNSHLGPATSTIYMDAKKGQFFYNEMDEYYGAYIDMLSGKSNNYILLNNTVDRYERAENERVYIVSGIWMKYPNLTSIVYTIDKDGKLTKDYLFGKPATADDAKYALFQTADYNPETGLYVTQVVEFVNGKKVVSIAWMNFN